MNEIVKEQLLWYRGVMVGKFSKKELLGFIIGLVIGLLIESYSLLGFLGFTDAPGGRGPSSYYIHYFVIPELLAFVAGPLVSWFISKSWKVAVVTLLILVIVYLFMWLGLTRPQLPKVYSSVQSVWSTNLLQS